jgi:hypothetical protein
MSAVAPQESPIAPRSDLRDAVGWTVLGAAVLIGSIRMDRLEAQHINPYTVPGLLPGLLGIAMILLGGTLGLRSWRRGALQHASAAITADQHEEWRRIWVVIPLCCGYGVGLIGHGLPFWLASTVYVTGSILILHRMSRDPQLREMSLRALLKAGVIGLASAWSTHLVFQDLFLVRLP